MFHSFIRPFDPDVVNTQTGTLLIERLHLLTVKLPTTLSSTETRFIVKDGSEEEIDHWRRMGFHGAIATTNEKEDGTTEYDFAPFYWCNNDQQKAYLIREMIDPFDVDLDDSEKPAIN